MQVFCYIDFILSSMHPCALYLPPPSAHSAMSEWIYEVITSPKIQAKNRQDFCPHYTGQKSWKILGRILGETMTSYSIFINSFWNCLAFSKKQRTAVVVVKNCLVPEKLCWIFFREASGILNNVLLIFWLEESLEILKEYILYQRKPVFVRSHIDLQNPDST